MTSSAMYNPDQVARLYEPDIQGVYEAGVQTYQRPATDDDPRVLAWLIDMQVDFVFPSPIGRLSVPNAIADTRRTIEWLYRNLPHITHIAASLDTHMPYHIFYPNWWKNKDGGHPAPFTVITADDVRAGRWLPATEPAWSVYYVETLERSSKKQLMIWPFHCMEGTVGRALVPALSEAIMFHSAARMAQPTFLTKGTIAHTEFYSVLEPEVKYPDHPDGVVNQKFLDFIDTFDLIYVAGQARSHCVLETMRSVLRYFDDNSTVLEKFRFLNDCSSSIAGFEEQTETAVSDFARRGIRLVQSTDPLE